MTSSCFQDACKYLFWILWISLSFNYLQAKEEEKKEKKKEKAFAKQQQKKDKERQRKEKKNKEDKSETDTNHLRVLSVEESKSSSSSSLKSIGNGRIKTSTAELAAEGSEKEEGGENPGSSSAPKEGDGDGSPSREGPQDTEEVGPRAEVDGEQADQGAPPVNVHTTQDSGMGSSAQIGEAEQADAKDVSETLETESCYDAKFIVHYIDVIMGAMASQITGVSIVCTTVSSGAESSMLRFTGLCEGNSPLTGEFPAQGASNAENVSIWWRHHVVTTNQGWF